MDTTEKLDDFVKVAIRIKPHLEDSQPNDYLKVIQHEPPVIVVPEKQQTYSFDHVFTQESNQEKIYNTTVKPLVQQILKGYNATVFAYGQTGTGKTFTIGTDPENYSDDDVGLITRALVDICNNIDENKQVEISISFLEIYNEKVYDLLSTKKTPLQVKGFNVIGQQIVKVENSSEALQLLNDGGKHRHKGETKQNLNSSRSHAIFTIICKVKHENYETEAKLNLVDLAGSESVRKTKNEGNQFHEGININKGLLYIGRVIHALSTNQAHIPYRQSVITTILQDSLNRKTSVQLIACISPNQEDMTESVQTFDFAQRAKRVKSKPELNLNNIIYEKPVLKPKISRPLYSSTVKKAPPYASFKSSFNNRVMVPETPVKIWENNSLRHTVTQSDILLNLSPVVQCISRMENRLFKKMEEVVRQMHKVENSPKVSKRLLNTEIREIMRSELNNLENTFRQSNGFESKNEDCPIDIERNEDEDEQIFESMDTSNASLLSTITMDTPPAKSSTPVFKLPLPKSFREQNILTSTTVRRSLRISMKPKKVESPQKVRRSVRLSMRVSMLPKTPELQKAKPISVKRTVNKKKTNSTKKASSHNEHVLNILNTGSHSDLVRLQTVGAKTADLLYNYREKNGCYRKISDLAKLPWRGNGYQRFLEQNLLTAY